MLRSPQGWFLVWEQDVEYKKTRWDRRRTPVRRPSPSPSPSTPSVYQFVHWSLISVRLDDSMKFFSFALLSSLAIRAYASTPTPTKRQVTTPPGFVKSVNGRFELDGKPFYFIGTNAYWLAQVINFLFDCWCWAPLPTKASIECILCKFNGENGSVRSIGRQRFGWAGDHLHLDCIYPISPYWLLLFPSWITQMTL